MEEAKQICKCSEREDNRRLKTGWLNIIRDDMKVYDMTKDMVQNRSVRHMKTKAGPLPRV